MIKTEILKRLADIEWDDFEAKEARNGLSKNIWESVSAFASSAGVWIVLGVSQQGKKFDVQGVENPEKLEQNFTTMLRSCGKFNVLIKTLAINKTFPDFRVDLLEIHGRWCVRNVGFFFQKYVHKIHGNERRSPRRSQTSFLLNLNNKTTTVETRQPLSLTSLLPKRKNILYINGVGIEHSPEYDAVREAVVNLLMYCDYFSPMKPRIRIFSDRIEFENPSAFPRPIPELLKKDVSIPRNPVLTKLFRCVKLADNAGYGFDKMLKWEAPAQTKVVFEYSIDIALVTFRLGKFVSEDGGQTGGQNIFPNEGLNEKLTKNEGLNEK